MEETKYGKNWINSREKRREEMIQLEMVFGLQIAIGILMIIFLLKISRIQKKIDKVIKEVESYISFIAEEEVVSEPKMDRVRAGQAEKRPVRKMTKQEKEDAQNKLIQSVLGEYFP